MNRLAIAGTAAALAAALLLARAPSTAQEAKPAAQSTIVATIDLSPIQAELSALRAEMATLRQAVADPKGLRDEVAQAGAAVKAMDARLAEVTELLKKQADALRPVTVAFDPATPWEYQCLRSRSESVANRLGREGWQLVTASADWLYFRRPLPSARRNEPIREPEKEKAQE